MSLRAARRRMLLAAVVLLIIDALAVVFLLSPWGRSRAALQQDYTQLREHLRTRRDDAQALTNIDAKIAEARRQIDQFLEQRIPARYSDVVAELGRTAQEHKVELTDVNYTLDDTDIPGLRQMGMAAKLEGGYAREVQFINALERSRLFFVIDSVTLAEEQGGTVRLAIELETFLRSPAGAPAAQPSTRTPRRQARP